MYTARSAEGTMGPKKMAIGCCRCVRAMRMAMLGQARTDHIYRLEQATEDPSALTQETIIQQLDPVEAARLDKVRNIGIAVRCAYITCS